MKKYFVSKGIYFLLATFLNTNLKAENTNITENKTTEDLQPITENLYEKENLNKETNQPINLEYDENEYKFQDKWLFYINWGTCAIPASSSINQLETDFLRSRFINLAVFYSILTINPNVFLYIGFGWSNIDYVFKPCKTKDSCKKTQEKDSCKQTQEFFTIKKTTGNLEVCPAKDRIQKDSSVCEITDSSLTTRPINISIETVLYTNKYYHNDGFIIALGFNLYFLQNPYTTIKYRNKKAKEEGFEYSSQTIHTDILTKSVQYGIYTKIKWGRLGIGYEWIPSNLFKKSTGLLTRNCSKISLSINLL